MRLLGTGLVLSVVVVLTGCGEMGQGETAQKMASKAEAETARPVPPTPDLPMTGAKAREIMGDLPLGCRSMATLKMDLLTCAERTGRPADHEAFRTELRDLRWNLQTLPPEEATARCSAMEAEMRSKPKPQACWDLGLG